MTFRAVCDIKSLDSGFRRNDEEEKLLLSRHPGERASPSPGWRMNKLAHMFVWQQETVLQWTE